MSYPNGNLVSDVKKNVSNAVSNTASNVASNVSSNVKNAKSTTKSAESAIEKKADETSDSVSSIASTVLSSALSLLPVKNTDEVYSMLQSTAKDVQSGLTGARDSAMSFVRKYPLYSLVGAAAIGASAILLLNARKSTNR